MEERLDSPCEKDVGGDLIRECLRVMLTRPQGAAESVLCLACGTGHGHDRESRRLRDAVALARDRSNVDAGMFFELHSRLQSLGAVAGHSFHIRRVV